ncbi:MAG: YqiA/YcfP family alpha/beta fold hydrolase [Sulfurimonadaceae bacterium]
MTVIYIHGFGGNGEGKKAKQFRSFFKEQKINFIAPSLSYIPLLAIKTLEELIESYLFLGEKVVLIGSSMGGYFSVFLACKYHLKAVLINPAVQPYETLKRAIDEGVNYYDGSRFEWNESYLAMLKELDTQVENPKNFMLLVQKGDEVLDYAYAVAKLEGALQYVEEGGDHSFVGVERYFTSALEFLESFE